MTHSAEKGGIVDLPGGKIHYEIAGKGQPLVLIHSALMNSKMWDTQVEAFAPSYQVIRYDLPGFGRSTLGTRGPDRVDLRGLLDALRIEKAALLGLSRGAEVALDFGLHYPKRVNALILCGAGLDGFPYPAEAQQRWQSFVEVVHSREFPRAVEHFIEDWVDGPRGPAAHELRQQARAIRARYSFAHSLPPDYSSSSESNPVVDDAAGEPTISAVAQAIVDALTDIAESSRMPAERLEEVKIPTLILAGDADRPAVLSITGYLAAHMPNARKLVIPDAADIINLQRPDVFNRAVLDFLRQAMLTQSGSKT